MTLSLLQSTLWCVHLNFYPSGNENWLLSLAQNQSGAEIWPAGWSEDPLVPFVMVRAAAACGLKDEEGPSVVINDGCLRLATTQCASSSSLPRMEALLNDWLWKEEFWLPPGTRWQDHLPLPRDLLYTLPLALAFIALRYVFERFCCTCLHQFQMFLLLLLVVVVMLKVLQGQWKAVRAVQT